MPIHFQIEKIVSYLDKYKPDLQNLYRWNPKVESLIDLNICSESQVNKINSKSHFERELILKEIIGTNLNESYKSNPSLFEKLCVWVIKDWGGITFNSYQETFKLIEAFLNKDKPSFTRIASTSKIGSFMFPERNVIYDSRVAYSLNWIILSENAGNIFFPIPEGRNSKMSAFDLNVLIRLKNISAYQTENIKDLDHRLFITNSDKKLFIDKKEAYFELNNLLKQVNQRLWKGDSQKEDKLYYTEMLLFSIADREIFMEITNRFKN